MGYFSNGTEGDNYEAEFCNRCAHEDGAQGCPVMLAHILHAYSEAGKGSAAEEILTLLIPRKKTGGNERCRMFISRDQVKRSTASRGAQHKAPDGGVCRNNGRKPVENGAGEVIGETCAGCGTPFALPGRAGATT